MWVESIIKTAKGINRILKIQHRVKKSEKEKEAIFLNLWLFGVDLNRSIENSKSNDLFTGDISFSFAHCEWASIGLNKANLSL